MEISGSKEEERRCGNRFPLSFYFRIANQIVNQAKVYRDEQNINDLYFTLKRYSSLLSEIIPQHPSYITYSAKEKRHHQKILKEFTKEIESVKLGLGRKINEVVGHQVEMPNNGGTRSDIASHRQSPIHRFLSSCNERKVKYSGTDENKTHRPDFSTNHVCRVGSSSISHYFVPAEHVELASIFMMDPRTGCSPCEPLCSMSSTMEEDCNIKVHIVTQSSPSPVLCCIENAPHAAHVSHINGSDSRSSSDESSASNIIHDVHISARLMEDFLELARENTEKDLETCGVLGAFLKNRTFYVTTLIIPKQESASNSCQALNEEEIFAIQDEESLFPVGWIHTHPSQSCFMSSVDLHTHYSYQVMLPEAFAVVMAPTDATRSCGIFRITDPGGITVLKERQERGFHLHRDPPDGSPIYEECSNVYINSNLRFEIIDLR